MREQAQPCMLAHAEYEPSHPLLVVVGNYGSGKTEVSVNLALHLAERGRRVVIADLDVVNPYFRCREATTEMETRGIQVIVPRGELHAADLPILLPAVRGAILGKADVAILDVGGDDVGARILGSLASAVAGVPHAVLQVVNERRPFTDTVAGCSKIMREIAASAKLAITGLVSNTHLLDDTAVDTVARGYAFAAEVAASTGLRVELVAAERRILEQMDPAVLDGTPVLPIDRRMLPPWYLRSRRTDKAARVLLRGALPGQPRT
jgi:hypothetical protein